MSAELREHAGEYLPTDVGLFRRVMRKSKVETSNYSFVDLGCGKGRALLAAAHYPFKAIVGVEADSNLYEVAKTNVMRWSKGRPESRIRLVQADARTVDLPAGNLFVFMYSPFRGPVFEHVAARLACLANEPGRAIVIAYLADFEADSLDRTGCFVRIRMRRLQFWARSTVSLFYNAAAIRLGN